MLLSGAGRHRSRASSVRRLLVLSGVLFEYDPGMTRKIAVSLPDAQVDSIRHAVERGRAASVSGFISAAVARAEHEDSLEMLLDDLDRELGPVSADDLAWADKALGLE